MRRPLALLVVVVVVVVAVGAVVAFTVAMTTSAQESIPGRIGASRGLLNNGRALQPYGRLVTLGQFPTGGALTTNGRYLWTVSAGRGANDVRIVSVRSGRVVQTLRLPGASGGIAMDPVRDVAYVSGVQDSEGRKDQQVPKGTPGVAGDVIHVFSYNRGTGSAKFDKLLATPPPSDAPIPQSFPPTNTKKVAWPDRLAVSPDGKRLLVPLNLADAAAIVDTASGAIKYVKTGNYPYGAAILPGGKRGLVSNETPGTVSVIDLDNAKKIGDIQVGPRLSHPEAIAVDPKAPRAYVALANSDQVVVIDTDDNKVLRTLSVERREGLGASPVDLTVTPDGRRLIVAAAGTDELVVFRLPGGATNREGGRGVIRADRMTATKQAADWSLEARIPTAQYPTAVAVSEPGANPCGDRTGKRRGKKAKRCSKLVWVSGKGLGTGPNPDGPQPNSLKDSDDEIGSTQYLPLLNIGAAGIGDFPTDDRLAALTEVATKQIIPANRVDAPADTPLRPGGPIKNVFYIVKENRTYDQIMGDDPRGDGDPNLALFGGDVTPNNHALAKRFPLLDHVYANSEASIDGHFWTSAAKVSDYVNKAWFANYGGRGRPYDFGVYSVTWPANGFLFDQAERQGISYFNYGEAIAGTIPLLDKDRTGEETQRVVSKFGKSDLGAAQSAVGAPPQCYANDASVGKDAITGQPVFDTKLPAGVPPTAGSRFDCFANRFAGQLATGTVPAFNYMVLTNDHTQTLTAGARTPSAMIADNDEAVGRIVELISKSPIWKSSAIFVIEDDSQDGADHVDAHRIPAYAISPYTKRGAVVNTRYDFLSVIRSMELILGMKPLGLFDELATPMYDAFTSKPDLEPYTAIPAKINLLATNPSTGAGPRMAASLPKGLDRAPQHEVDALLWKSVYGLDAVPPPAGPNASGEGEEDEGD